MTRQNQAKLFLTGGHEGETATFTWTQTPEGCRLACECRGTTITAIDNDFYNALRTIRRVLEQERLIPHCYGASMNVCPWGASRQQSLGLSAYKLERGRVLVKRVNIFDTGPDVVPSTVRQQE